MSKKYAVFITVLFCAFLGAFAVANALTPDRGVFPPWRTAIWPSGPPWTDGTSP